MKPTDAPGLGMEVAKWSEITAHGPFIEPFAASEPYAHDAVNCPAAAATAIAEGKHLPFGATSNLYPTVKV
jgi:hypothetical protein